MKDLLRVRAGLMVTERNWLEVYPYTKWGGNDSLPHLQEGQTFMPSHLMLKEVRHLGFLCVAWLSATITLEKFACLILLRTASTVVGLLPQASAVVQAC